MGGYGTIHTSLSAYVGHDDVQAENTQQIGGREVEEKEGNGICTYEWVGGRNEEVGEAGLSQSRRLNLENVFLL